ncbi:IS3 family transposase, partial [Lactococcus lactis]
SKTQLRRQHLALKIDQLFKANRGIYGAPKIHHLLLNQGEKVGIKLVQKIMQQLQLKSVVLKKFKPGHSVSDGINRKNLI